MRAMGIFHALEVYDINWFSETSCSFPLCVYVESYKGKEGEATADEPRVVVLASKFLLVFQPEKKQTTAGDYYILTTVISLVNLRSMRKRIAQPGIITLEWMQIKENENLTLVLEDIEAFIEDLLERAKKLNAKVECSRQVREMVVKVEAVSAEQANKLTDAARDLELRGDNENLVRVYRSLAQYYYSTGNELYRSFLAKMKDAVRRRDSHKPETAKTPSSKDIEMNIIEVC
eukprot:TRINITY_DN10315_c0_g1_i6.p2 TRINITY_DN10315_c0_g1~~TRINITY_DN10315_c0_g1_i6.p2  ORF type:complete len:232 (+),score=78.51 TRINITY_DN10315_c0_g1_i6:561-1256(+)